ncbi:hypothetical protein FACS1894109_02020 [Spirochaetia bacterium]|nr:hypothetical protein FACS1894109_02020 [Spirochaetia bacterium]
MINLFVDASLLAFPPKEMESTSEFNNIKDFLDCICNLDKLIKENPDITVSIKKNIEDFLLQKKAYFIFDEDDVQRDRINRINRLSLTREPRDVKRIYTDIFKRSLRYNCVNWQQNSNFEQELKNIIAHISSLISHYNINNQRLVVNNDIQISADDNIQVCKINESNKEFNYEIQFKSFEEAFNEINNNYKDTICFGDEIYTDEESLWRKNKKKTFSNYDIPDRLFYYLDNLSDVARYLQRLPTELSEDEINDIVNSFGCNSVAYGKKYKNCRRRCWYDGTQKSVFSLHLRPKTGNDKNTMRIYYKWKNEVKKFQIGMINIHAFNDHDECIYRDKCKVDW